MSAAEHSGARGEAPIEIPAHLLHEVFREARRAFPAECCGWLSGPVDRPGLVDRCRPCENAQEQGEHPTRPERSARTAYLLAVSDLLALNRSFDEPQQARVIYHSHTNGSAYFSKTDRDLARNPWGDGPSYPVQHLVIGIDARAVSAASLFAWSEANRQFVQVAQYPGVGL